MLNLQRLVIDHFVAELQNTYRRMYSDVDSQFGNIISWTGHLALENIANSDALYHDLHHTIMVTLAGQTILEGKHLLEGGVTPLDWLQFTIALLCHDIGYVRGVCSLDSNGRYATGKKQETVEIPNNNTDVALTPYHVDRSQCFVRERFGGKMLLGMESIIDVKTINAYIEMTRFPPPDDDWYQDTQDYPGLLRAADFIGQLGEPNYWRKTPALFYEFEEIGANKNYGYEKPGDLRANFAKFYWDVVSPYIQEAIRYLRVTQEGRQWIANLQAHVFASENEDAL